MLVITLIEKYIFAIIDETVSVRCTRQSNVNDYYLRWHRASSTTVTTVANYYYYYY